MSGFEKVKFNGTFRDYQKRVLSHASKYLADGKMHIVAAPGSGKTTLGLELVRRLGNPCIIFSPTTTIKNQWGVRFEEAFLPKGERVEDYVSYDLNQISLINSVTYQALYSAMNRVRAENEEETVDYSSVDLFALIKKSGIKTICLDEAHHLQNEWQKALEAFLSAIESEVTVIALTATPPYDATPAEWERYQKVCGEIDEEIFVPELVKKGTLCPHQDYVYFNYPTEEETDALSSYRSEVDEALSEIEGKYLPAVYKKIRSMQRDYEVLYENAKEYIAILVLAEHAGISVEKKLVKELTAEKKLPPFDYGQAELAVRFLLSSSALLSEREKQTLTELLKKHSLFERGLPCLTEKERLRRSMLASVSKLKSICEIARSEDEALSSSLRMLILTDFIKKESLSAIGTKSRFSDISVISVFETLRRANLKIPLGVVSGSVVILPDEVTEGEPFKRKPLGSTGYSLCEMGGGNKNKVDYVGKLFEEGKIRILIGTKSLLGEGWDAPCVNSLILASYVGSFMLTNQMRGRAIRMDRTSPDKVANVWHLSTVEPVNGEDGKEQAGLCSHDWCMLSRRFECFVGPNYETGEIESGVERLSVIKPPYSESGINQINAETLLLSKQRKRVRGQWGSELKNGYLQREVNVVPNSRKMPVFTFWNAFPLLLVLCLFAGYLALIVSGTLLFLSPLGIALLVLIAPTSLILFRVGYLLWVHLSPTHSVSVLCGALLAAMKELKLISNNARLSVQKSGENAFVFLTKASAREQHTFNAAVTELLSPIENPRYLLIQKKWGRRCYSVSYACPSALGQKQEYVEVFRKRLKFGAGVFEVCYTRKDGGRALMMKCKKSSYITPAEKRIATKKKTTGD